MLCSAKLLGDPSMSSWSLRSFAGMRGNRRWSAEVETFRGRGAGAAASSTDASASGTAVPQKPHSALIRPMYHCERPHPGQWFDSLAR
jgi:hypothetical protein